MVFNSYDPLCYVHCFIDEAMIVGVTDKPEISMASHTPTV
jgi:hypothetical protein